MRCGAPPVKREPSTTSAGPGTMGFRRVLYPPWSYLGQPHPAPAGISRLPSQYLDG